MAERTPGPFFHEDGNLKRRWTPEVAGARELVDTWCRLTGMIDPERDVVADLLNKGSQFDEVLKALKDLQFRAHLQPEDQWAEDQALAAIAKAEATDG